MLFKVIIMPLKKALQDIWNLWSRYLGSHFDFRDKQRGQHCNGVIMLNMCPFSSFLTVFFSGSRKLDKFNYFVLK